ncbi:MAG: hypothetical protein JWP91_1714 [Fibrobacteres bacterium]|nr:hypothetical protein [Fibrobacterota bacterium]
MPGQGLSFGLFWGLIWVLLPPDLQAQEDPEIAGFEYILGSQTFGPSYHFTSEDAVVESARAIKSMGSSMIKALGADSREDLLALSFRTTFSWYEDDKKFPWTDGVTPQERTAIRDAAYARTKSLLVRYDGTGRSFFLGHWEGDWQLLGGTVTFKEPPAAAIQGMVDWYNARQQGIDEAKRDTPHKNVEVWQYAEVNRVRDAMVDGKQRIVNAVLPRTNVDFVSYSSYDAMRLGQGALDSTLDYVASKLPPKAGLAGKRVFIGEFGIPAAEVAFDGYGHEKANREIMIKFLKWGCPYILYWEMYNNEIANGSQRGFWLIDDKNEKQPLYHTLEGFLAQGKAYVADQKSRTGKIPSTEAFRAWAIAWLGNYQPTTGLLPAGSRVQSRPEPESKRFDWTLGGFLQESAGAGRVGQPRFRVDGVLIPLPQVEPHSIPF